MLGGQEFPRTIQLVLEEHFVVVDCCFNESQYSGFGSDDTCPSQALLCFLPNQAKGMAHSMRPTIFSLKEIIQSSSDSEFHSPGNKLYLHF